MIEIIRDLVLLGTILFMIGGPQALLDSPLTFTSGVVVCLSATVFLPLIFSTLGLALEDPSVILKQYNIATRSKKIIMQSFILIFSFFNPFLLLNSIHENQRRLREETGSRLVSRLKDGARLGRLYCQFLKTELGLETIYQLPIQLTLLLHSKTLTNTTGGLEAVFKKTELLGISADHLLALTTVWCFKTCISLHLREGFKNISSVT